MAVIAVEAVVALAVTGASVVIPVTVAGVTLAVANSKLGHVTTVVGDRSELKKGTHISYKYKKGFFDKFSYRHAIVAEDGVAIDGQSTKLIYWFQGKVICDDVQLTANATGTRRCAVYRHEYNYLITYGREAVAARARSLSREYVQPERHGAIHNCWSCFDGDEQFAIWCHTGVRPATRSMVRGMVSTDYKYVKVCSIDCLRTGDHVCFESSDVWFYQHGIVVKVDKSNSTVEITCKKNGVNLPQTETLREADYFGRNNKYKLYRYDYDIALGCKSELTVQKALNETRNETRSNGPSVYKDDVDFAVWCKLSVVISPNDASTLAKARVVSSLHATVGSRGDLRHGDHVVFDGQHLIVEKVTVTKGVTQLIAILMPKVEPGTGSGKRITQKTFENVENALSSGSLELYFYDSAEASINEQDVLVRARQHLGTEVDDLPFKDSQHFAMWCRTGERQLNFVSWQLRQ